MIDHSAAMLLHRGTPYPGPAMIAAAHSPNIFDPYLPALTAFGIPRVLLGFSPATDPRIWFAAGFVVAFAAALAVAGARDVVRWTALVTASPLIAFSLAVGGTDMPVLACMCLGFALLWRRPRPVLAGLALGAAAAMKATAWPALVVAVVLLVARDGRRAAASMAATALVIVAARGRPGGGPGAAVPGAEHDRVPARPDQVKSAAVSPLPGRLLAETGPTGHLIAVALLALAGLAVIASLAFRPPRSLPAATWRLIIALTAMFVLAPATRFGYFVYPVGLFAWLEVSLMGQAAPAAPADSARGGGAGRAARAAGTRRGRDRRFRPPGGVPAAEPGSRPGCQFVNAPPGVSRPSPPGCPARERGAVVADVLVRADALEVVRVQGGHRRPFDFGWLVASPANFEPMIRLRVPAWRVLTCFTWTPATSFLSVFTSGSWAAELYSMMELV